MHRSLRRSMRSLLRSFGLEVRHVRSPFLREGVYSYLDEQYLIESYLNLLTVESRYCVDIGADDGISGSNSFPLFREGWHGLAVEYDAWKFASLANTYSNFDRVDLVKCTVTPTNVLLLLATHDVPEMFGFLTLDIDGYDHDVLDQILSKYRPQLICAEINEVIPPPIKFTVKWQPDHVWEEDFFFGQSISQLHVLCTRYDYAMVELHYNNAFLIPMEHSLKPALSAENAYRSGYLDKPDRKDKFPWNDKIEMLLHMSPDDAIDYINKLFEKHKGAYELTL